MKKIGLELDLEIRVIIDGDYEYMQRLLCARPSLCTQCYYSCTADEETER